MKLYLKKSQVVVLGCTELAVMLDESKLPVINTLDVLVDAVVDIFKSKTLRR